MKEINGNLQAKNRKFAIILGRFNDFIGDKLLGGAIDCLIRHGASMDDIDTIRVPGAFEIPLAAQKAANCKRYDALICLGAVIRGETPHFDFVAAEMSKGIASVSLSSGLPVAFGVLTTDSIEQAVSRAGSKSGNKGWEAALSAIEMADLLEKI